MNRLLDHEVMDPEVERETSMRMRRMLDLEQKYRGFPVAAVARREFARCRARLVSGCLRFVAFVAKQFRYGPIRWRMDELISEGYYWLLRNAEHYDPARGYRFSTFAGAVLRNRFLNVTGRRDSAQRRQHRRHASVRHLNFDIADRGCGSDEPFTNEHRGAVAKAVGQLRLRERMVIEQRYNQWKPATRDAIGAQLGVSRQYVEQLEATAIQRIRCGMPISLRSD